MTTRYFVVNCTRHGMESKNWAGKQVRVGQPRTKTERKDGGCPTCSAEALKEAQAAAEVARVSILR